MYAFVLAGIQREFLRYTKLSYKLEFKKLFNLKKLYGPFLWMGFNCLKARIGPFGPFAKIEQNVSP